MKPHSRHLLHVGINFLISPPPVIAQETWLQFQQAIVSQGLEFHRFEYPGNQFVLTREAPSPLQLSVALLPLPNVPFGQILIIGPNATTGIDYFIKEAEAALSAYDDVWPAQNRQIIQSDATIRELYETTSQHAFQELWEKRLGQQSQALAAFGRPIRGGGLRFVMDPLPNESEPIQIEVKIESFLMDTSKIFVETQFAWRTPSAQGAPFNAGERLQQMNSYTQNQIRNFITGETS